MLTSRSGHGDAGTYEGGGGAMGGGGGGYNLWLRYSESGKSGVCVWCHSLHISYSCVIVNAALWGEKQAGQDTMCKVTLRIRLVEDHRPPQLPQTVRTVASHTRLVDL